MSDHDFHFHHHYCGGDDGGSGGDGSGLKAFLCVVGGFLLMALLLMGLGIEADSVPAFVLIVLWILMTSGLAGLFMRK